jgi:hypothetical protein
MGMIRKTLSVGTLGLVSFRSKKEKLRRAERARRDAESTLENERAARVNAEQRIDAAEKRVKHASAAAAHAARQLERTKKRRRRGRERKVETIAELRAGVEPLVRSGFEGARHAGADATKRGRRAGRKARKAAKKSLRRAKEAAATTATAAREATAEVVEAAKSATRD